VVFLDALAVDDPLLGPVLHRLPAEGLGPALLRSRGHDASGHCYQKQTGADQSGEGWAAARAAEESQKAFLGL
jgi:hypothetical protein